MPAKPRRADLQYDDEQDEALAPVYGRVPWPKTPDEMDCRWAPYGAGRGWLTVRDPFTLERHEVPTKYAEVKLQPGQTVAPQEWVRRAMEKLPPRRRAR